MSYLEKFKYLWNLATNNINHIKNSEQSGAGNLIKPYCDLTPITSENELLMQLNIKNIINESQLSHIIMDKIKKGAENEVSISKCERYPGIEFVFRKSTSGKISRNEYNDYIKEMKYQLLLSLENLSPKIFMVGIIKYPDDNHYLFSFQEMKQPVLNSDFFEIDKEEIEIGKKENMEKVMDMYDAVGKKGILNIDVKMDNILKDENFEKVYIIDLDEYYFIDDKLLTKSIEDAQTICSIDSNIIQTIRGDIMKYLFLMSYYVGRYEGEPQTFPYEYLLRNIVTKEFFTILMCILRNSHMLLTDGKYNSNYSDKAENFVLLIKAYHYRDYKGYEINKKITSKINYMIHEKLMIPRKWLYGRKNDEEPKTEYDKINDIFYLKTLLDAYLPKAQAPEQAKAQAQAQAQAPEQAQTKSEQIESLFKRRFFRDPNMYLLPPPPPPPPTPEKMHRITLSLKHVPPKKKNTQSKRRNTLGGKHKRTRRK